MWNVTPTTSARGRLFRERAARPRLRIWACACPSPTAASAAGVPLVVGIVGNPDFQTEKLTELEGGYRFQIGSRGGFDVAVFRGSYGRLRR